MVSLTRNVVLLTRPTLEGNSLANELKRRGFQTSLAPMIHLIWYDTPRPNLDDAQAIVFTSANGVRAFARLGMDTTLAVYAVGDKTATLARNIGFQDVHSADGNAEDLVHLITHSCRPQHGRLIYIGAIGNRFGASLTPYGFVLDSYPLYEVDPIGVLPPESIRLWQQGQIVAVLLFSLRTARLFLQALDKAHCHPEGNVTAFCLSRNVADVLATQNLLWRNIVTAAKPRQDILLDMLNIPTSS